MFLIVRKNTFLVAYFCQFFSFKIVKKLLKVKISASAGLSAALRGRINLFLTTSDLFFCWTSRHERKLTSFFKQVQNFDLFQFRKKKILKILRLNRYTALWRLGATQILALEFLRSRAEQNQLILNFRSPLINKRS